MHHYWVRKGDEVLKEDFNNLWIITRLFVFDNLKEITSFLEDMFQVKIIINPFFDDKAIIKVNHGKLDDLITPANKMLCPPIKKNSQRFKKFYRKGYTSFCNAWTALV